MNEDVQDRVIESGVGGVAVRFPAAIREVEFDRAADRIAGIESDDGVGEIRSGRAIPGAKLDDLNVVAGDGMELSAEVAGKPARLQFQFAGGALRRKERAFMDARGIAQLGITVGKQHGGRGIVGGFTPFGDKKISGRDASPRRPTYAVSGGVSRASSRTCRRIVPYLDAPDLNVRDRLGRQRLDRRGR